MFGLKLIHVLMVLNAILFVRSLPLENGQHSVYIDPLQGENEELIREKRDPEPTRKGHVHHLIHHHVYHNANENYGHGDHGGHGGHVQHHSSGSAPVATFAQSSAGAISGNKGPGHGGSQSNSQSASYSFGPFSASFSASHANAGGGFFDY